MRTGQKSSILETSLASLWALANRIDNDLTALRSMITNKVDI